MMIPQYRLSFVGKESWKLARTIFKNDHGQAYFCHDGYSAFVGTIYDEVDNYVHEYLVTGIVTKEEAHLLCIWCKGNLQRLMDKKATMEVS